MAEHGQFLGFGLVEGGQQGTFGAEHLQTNGMEHLHPLQKLQQLG